jgi:hypothetical protein
MAKTSHSGFLPPPGFQLLSRGGQGDAFISSDGHEVVKCFLKDTDAINEWNVLKRVIKVAPEYTAGPAKLFRATNSHPDGVHVQSYYALRMRYVGQTLESKIHDLSLEEFCLCILQAIDFTLLLGTEIEVHDNHDANMCVSMSDSHIQLRWIDLARWKVITQTRSHFTIIRNAEQLVCISAWWHMYSKDMHSDVFTILLHFQDTYVKNPIVPCLKTLAAHICDFLKGSTADYKCHDRAQAIMAAIEQNALVAEIELHTLSLLRKAPPDLPLLRTTPRT